MFILRFILVLLFELHGAISMVHKSSVYTASSLTESFVHIDIRSDIPGNIRWVFTNEAVLTLTVNLTAENQQLLDETSIFYQSNSSSCVLHMDAYTIQSEAAVTGTGSRNCHVIFLIWMSMVIMEWRYIYLLILLLFANGVVQTFAMRIKPVIPVRSVDIEILAPRRFQYTEPKLAIDGGEIRLINTETDNVPSSIACITDIQEDTSCESCCHGNGYCFQNQCHCDLDFDGLLNCSMKQREDTFFSHPLDPRLTRTVLPSGEVVTMSYISNDKDKLGRVKNHDLVYLDTRSELNSSIVYFYSDGMIKKINLRVHNQTYTMQIKRSRDSQCQGTLIVSSDQSKRYSNKVDICGILNGLKSKRNDSVSNELKSYVKRYSNSETSNGHLDHHKRKNTDSKRRWFDVGSTSNQRRLLSEKLSQNYVDIPVAAMRCAREHAHDYNVMFEMLAGSETSYMDTNSDQETVYLRTKLGTKDYRTQRYLQLPRGREIGSNNSKCKDVNHTRNKVCNKDLLSIYKQICDYDDIQHSSNATKTMLSLLKAHCSFILNVLSHFCDNRQMTNDHSQTDCSSLFSHSVDLFSSPNYFLRPIVTFTDGKKIVGSWREVTMQNIIGLQKTGIVIQDDKPEVKIVKVSVIPTDPVPQDIYQVRLEYACATNQTVIRMNVTGSDKYKNHVTCTGITDCSCCILHAAGAKDAVVDHVTINITDSLSGINTIKQMVVIF